MKGGELMKLCDLSQLDFNPEEVNEGYDKDDIVNANIFSKAFKTYPDVFQNMVKKMCIMKFDKYKTNHEIGTIFGISEIDVEKILQVTAKELYLAASVNSNIKLDISDELAQKLIYFYLRKVEAKNVII